MGPKIGQRAATFQWMIRMKVPCTWEASRLASIEMILGGHGNMEIALFYVVLTIEYMFCLMFDNLYIYVNNHIYICKC